MRHGLVAAFFFAICSHVSIASVDLHSHAFMKEGMGLLFKGDFNGHLKAKSWKNKLASQINPETLKQSGLKIFVTALYAHPVLAGAPFNHAKGVKKSIRRQIALARKFVAENPQWVLARNAQEAQGALEKDKQVMLLALEGAHSLLESEEDLKEFIDESGISIVAPIHLIDNQFGGSSYSREFIKFIFTTRPFSRTRENGIKINPKGLTAKGRWLIAELVKRKVWVDMTHASDRAVRDMLPLVTADGQPLLFTHTVLRKYYAAERALSDEHIAAIKKHGGIVGLVPSEEMLEGTLPEEDDCGSGFYSLIKQYNELSEMIGKERIAMGSDFNGGIDHLKPTPCFVETRVNGPQGYWHIGQTKSLWQTMQLLGANVPENNLDLVESFLRAWGRVR